MVTQNSFEFMLLAAVCLIVHVSYGFQLPTKCTVDDKACVGKSFTYIIQHSKDYPELELPNLEPYRPPESWTFNGSLLVPYEIETSNMTCDGFKDLIVGNFSGFTNGTDGSTEFKVKLIIPKIKVVTDFRGFLKLPVVGVIKPEAVLTMDMTDAEMPITVGGEFIKQGDKEFFNVKSVNSDLFLSNVKSDISIKGNWFQKLKEAFWTGPATALMNLEWKLIKGEMEKDKEKFNVVILEIFKQILDRVAIQDIFLS